jgi:hypothetical protein
LALAAFQASSLISSIGQGTRNRHTLLHPAGQFFWILRKKKKKLQLAQCD